MGGRWFTKLYRFQGYNSINIICMLLHRVSITPGKVPFRLHFPCFAHLHLPPNPLPAREKRGSVMCFIRNRNVRKISNNFDLLLVTTREINTWIWLNNYNLITRIAEISRKWHTKLLPNRNQADRRKIHRNTGVNRKSKYRWLDTILDAPVLPYVVNIWGPMFLLCVYSDFP